MAVLLCIGLSIHSHKMLFQCFLSVIVAPLLPSAIVCRWAVIVQSCWRLSVYRGSWPVGDYFLTCLIIKCPESLSYGFALLILYCTEALWTNDMSQWIATMWIFKENSMNKSTPHNWMRVLGARAVTDNRLRSQDVLVLIHCTQCLIPLPSRRDLGKKKTTLFTHMMMLG